MKLTKEQIIEIDNQKNQKNFTKRVIAPELEKVLYDVMPASAYVYDATSNALNYSNLSYDLLDN